MGCLDTAPVEIAGAHAINASAHPRPSSLVSDKDGSGRPLWSGVGPLWAIRP